MGAVIIWREVVILCSEIPPLYIFAYNSLFFVVTFLFTILRLIGLVKIVVMIVGIDL
jgi:hypothetical protein